MLTKVILPRVLLGVGVGMAVGDIVGVGLGVGVGVRFGTGVAAGVVAGVQDASVSTITMKPLSTSHKNSPLIAFPPLLMISSRDWLVFAPLISNPPLPILQLVQPGQLRNEL
jgi:hypothetical protein